MTNDILPADYGNFLQQIKERIQHAQLKAVISVNAELILMYWNLGKEILARQEKEGWGTGVIEQLSKDLHATFPQMKGFSIRNLKYMRAFAQTYPDISFVQTVSAQMTWSHNIALLDRLKDEKERLWYAQQAIEHGWSLSILEMHIETKLYQRQGKALTNFKTTLPAPDSDLAHYMLKDPYIFDFITTDDEEKERNLQQALLANIRRFLLELGTGFTFVGSNYHLVVGKQDFYIDLLFYHTKLHCYIVIELKSVVFKPEYAGKLSFYMTAVDEQIKSPEDKPTIGLILCRGDHDKVVVEYALRNIHAPLGVATYTTSLPDELKRQLPDINKLKQQLEKPEEEIIQSS